MKNLTALSAIVAALVAGCGGNEAEESRPGLAAVYASIEAETDCATLQETFDRNMDRYELRDVDLRTQAGSPGEIEFSYANAAQDRIADLGC